MTDIRCAPRAVAAAVVATALAASFAAPSPATADGVINPLKSRLTAAGNIWKLASKLANERHKCARDIELGNKPWSIDCSEDPVSVGGAGTGDAEVDEALATAYSKPLRKYLSLREKGTPEEHGVDTLCDPPSNSWTNIDACIFDIYSDASKALFDLRVNTSERVVSGPELTCRATIHSKLVGVYQRILKQRAKCFKLNGLLGDGSFAALFDCRAPLIPPGLGRPDTGIDGIDSSLESALVGLRGGIFGNCPDDLASYGFPGPLTDPTGGRFGRIDLVAILIEGLVQQTEVVMEALYDGVPQCGDGTTDADLGEECDDGNLTNCDGCDINCQLPACGNAVGCAAEAEQCDDGDDTGNDGCTPACVLEYCSDGLVQGGIGESCDDSNLSNGDGCNSRCQIEE